MKTNNLCYKTEKQIGNEIIHVTIELNDECKNGYTDFCITGEICNMYGCLHEKILKYFPEFKIFVELHLVSTSGISRSFIDNCMYFLKEKNIRFLKGYGLTEKEIKELIDAASDDIDLRYLLGKFGYTERQKEKAQEAIKLLEELTGDTFIDSNKPLIIKPLTNEEIVIIKNRIKNNHYSIKGKETYRIEKLRKRASCQLEEVTEKIRIRDERMKNVIYKDELDIERFILEHGLPIDNFIYYKHSQEGVFNWLDYKEKITQQDFDEFIKQVDYKEFIPGFKFKLKKEGQK